MMRMLAVAVAIAALLLTTSGVSAQPLCQLTAFRQDDMAGQYISVESRMQVTIFPCGGIDVMWSNEYGTHQTSYAGVERLQGGGIIARVLYPDPMVRSLDGRNTVTLKPAEAGYIEAWTIGPFVDNVKTYRLHKMS